jgi:hypothetical protein
MPSVYWRFTGLVETGAWYYLLGWQPSLEVGSIVVWGDPTTKRVSCKRIVGIEGYEIRRCGQYVYLYQDREDWAIVWPSDAEKRHLDKECPWDTAKSTDKHQESMRTMVVPPQHVLLCGMQRSRPR